MSSRGLQIQSKGLFFPESNISNHNLNNSTPSEATNRTKKYTRYHYNIRPKEETFTESTNEDEPRQDTNMRKVSQHHVDIENNTNPDDEFYDRVGMDFGEEDTNYEDLNVSEANRVSSSDATKKPEYDYLYYYYYDYVYPDEEKNKGNQLESLPKPSFLVDSENEDLESSTTSSTDNVTLEPSS